MVYSTPCWYAHCVAGRSWTGLLGLEIYCIAYGVSFSGFWWFLAWLPELQPFCSDFGLLRFVMGFEFCLSPAYEVIWYPCNRVGSSLYLNNSASRPFLLITSALGKKGGLWEQAMLTQDKPLNTVVSWKAFLSRVFIQLFQSSLDAFNHCCSPALQKK